MPKMKDASEKGWGSDAKGRVAKAPAAAKGGSEVGPERHANMRGVMDGGSRAEGADHIRSTGGYGSPVGETSMKSATHELRKQHPHHHSAGGIHGTMDHQRHEPMHGLRPHKGH